MAARDKLLERIKRKPKDFTVSELDTLMRNCGCACRHGGRGSSLRYYHLETGRVLIFDGPHPEKELYPFQIKKVLAFLEELGY